MTSFEIGNVQVDIKKADKLYAISFAGYNLCSVDDKDKIIYNISELEKFKEKAKELMENGMPDLTEELGIPDIEYLKYLEKAFLAVSSSPLNSCSKISISNWIFLWFR